MSDQKLYAFWRYDLFPFVLHGPVAEMRDDGAVKMENYGRASFYPLLILPLEAGKALGAKIEKIKQGHHEAKEAFDAEWKAKMDALSATFSHESARVRRGPLVGKVKG